MNHKVNILTENMLNHKDLSLIQNLKDDEHFFDLFEVSRLISEFNYSIIPLIF